MDLQWQGREYRGRWPPLGSSDGAPPLVYPPLGTAGTPPPPPPPSSPSPSPPSSSPSSPAPSQAPSRHAVVKIISHSSQLLLFVQKMLQFLL